MRYDTLLDLCPTAYSMFVDYIRDRYGVSVMGYFWKLSTTFQIGVFIRFFVDCTKKDLDNVSRLKRTLLEFDILDTPEIQENDLCKMFILLEATLVEVQST